MRILWLKSDLLLPLDKGGKLRTWHLLRHLAARHDITYLAFAEPDQPAADVEGMHEVAVRVETVARTDRPKGSLGFYLDAALHLVDPVPYAVGKYRSSAFRQKLQALLDEQAFDVIVCDFLVPAINLPRRLPCPAVIFTHNVESEIWRRHAETKRGAVSKFLYGTQYRRMLRYEAETLKRFDGVLAVSDADCNSFARLYPGAVTEPVHVVPTGVDTTYFSPLPGEVNPSHIVFTGSMDWLPNEDAMQYFCRQILPAIRAEIPDVALSIVGRAPTPAVRALADQAGVHVTGSVADVRPYVGNAAVYVVPLRIGGGTRLKIFEAMAMGKAVVSTTVGAEGLPITSGEDLVLADDPADFSRAVIGLIRDPQRRDRLGAAARALVVDRYDWSAVAGSMEDALVRVALGRAQPARVTADSARFAAVGARATGRSL